MAYIAKLINVTQEKAEKMIRNVFPHLERIFYEDSHLRSNLSIPICDLEKIERGEVKKGEYYYNVHNAFMKKDPAANQMVDFSFETSKKIGIDPESVELHLDDRGWLHLTADFLTVGYHDSMRTFEICVERESCVDYMPWNDVLEAVKRLDSECTAGQLDMCYQAFRFAGTKDSDEYAAYAAFRIWSLASRLNCMHLVSEYGPLLNYAQQCDLLKEADNMIDALSIPEQLLPCFQTLIFQANVTQLRDVQKYASLGVLDPNIESEIIKSIQKGQIKLSDRQECIKYANFIKENENLFLEFLRSDLLGCNTSSVMALFGKLVQFFEENPDVPRTITNRKDMWNKGLFCALQKDMEQRDQLLEVLRDYTV